MRSIIVERPDRFARRLAYALRWSVSLRASSTKS